MDFFHQANLAFIDEDFDSALEKYNQACEACDNYAPAFACRAALYMKLKKSEEALQVVMCIIFMLI
jgi:hypothetical protein